MRRLDVIFGAAHDDHDDAGSHQGRRVHFDPSVKQMALLALLISIGIVLGIAGKRVSDAGFLRRRLWWPKIFPALQPNADEIAGNPTKNHAGPGEAISAPTEKNEALFDQEEEKEEEEKEVEEEGQEAEEPQKEDEEEEDKDAPGKRSPGSGSSAIFCDMP